MTLHAVEISQNDFVFAVGICYCLFSGFYGLIYVFKIVRGSYESGVF